jgi:NAD(P)-dependent dehydrogenase (short-subunit alcohol dehydrogenase family)
MIGHTNGNYASSFGERTTVLTILAYMPNLAIRITCILLHHIARASMRVKKAVVIGVGLEDGLTSLTQPLIGAGRMDPTALTNRTRLGPLGDRAEVAEIALYLESDVPAFIAGHALMSDGGWIAKGFEN